MSNIKKPMKIWKISQKDADYDEYVGAVVCAETEEEARNIHPEIAKHMLDNKGYLATVWVEPKDVIVEFICTAKEDIKKGVIFASFNAG